MGVTSSLLDQETSLQSEIFDLEADKKSQKRYTQHVLELVENWNEKVDGVIKKRLEEERLIKATIQDYFSSRSHSLEESTLIDRITPIILEEVQLDLENYFKKGDSGKIFVNEIVQYLQVDKESH
jgi:hypothetical protein